MCVSCVSCNRCSSGDLKNLRFCVWSHNFEPGDLLWTARFLIFKMYLKCWLQSLMPLLQTDKQAMPDKHILLVMISKDENIVNYFFSKTLWKNSLRKSHLNNFCGQRGMKAAMGKCCLSSDTLASSPNPPSPYLHHLEGALPPRNHHLPHTVMMQKPPSRGYTAPGGGHVRNCWKRICISWNIERLLQLWIIFMSHLLADIFRVGKKIPEG